MRFDFFTVGVQMRCRERQMSVEAFPSCTNTITPTQLNICHEAEERGCRLQKQRENKLL